MHFQATVASKLLNMCVFWDCVYLQAHRGFLPGVSTPLICLYILNHNRLLGVLGP